MKYQLHQQRSYLNSNRFKISSSNASKRSHQSDYSSQAPSISLQQMLPLDFITDYINAIYQGLLSLSTSIQGKPDGLGIVIDDDFTFILCDDWKNGKMNGHTFIKLMNQITIWGIWGNNIPIGVMTAQIKEYLVFLPYRHIDLVPDKRLTRCLVYNENKDKAYIAVIDRKQDQKSSREYSIVIQKIVNCKQWHEVSQKLRSLSKNIFEYDLETYMYSPQQFLTFLYSKQIICASRDLEDYQQMQSFSKHDKKVLICINEQSIRQEQRNMHQEESLLLRNYKLYTQTGEYKQRKCKKKIGIVLDWRKMLVDSIGTYSIQNSKQIPNLITGYKLNGIGLSKTLGDDPIIGIYKNDLIIKEITNKQTFMNDIDKSDPDQLANRLKISQVVNQIRQKLTHQHMKSLSYAHDYLLYPEIAKISRILIQINQYITIFLKLAANHTGVQSSSSGESAKINPITQTHQFYEEHNSQMHHFDSEKYGSFNKKERKISLKSSEKQQSSSLFGQLRREVHKKTTLEYVDKISENYNMMNTKNIQIRIEQQPNNANKRPGFITRKSPISIKPLERSPSPVQLKLSNSYRKNGSISQPRKTFENNYMEDRSRSKSGSKGKQKNINEYRRWRI